MSNCSETVDGIHIWVEYTIPSRAHFGDIETIETPACQMRECLACGESEVA